MSQDTPFDFISRTDILAGFLLRRARNLLFAIENRVAYLKSLSRQEMDRFLTAEQAKQNDLLFLESFSLGKRPPVKISIQDIERYAPQWAFLAPASANLRAALIHHLAEKYSFAHQAVPQLRAALALDDETVAAAYQRIYQQPLSSVYAPQTSPTERLRWLWAGVGRWVDNLPPAWSVFALTLTETVGAGILALPIVLAGLGPLPAAVLLIVLGLFNVLTIAFMAEAITRSGTNRYGQAFIGKVIASYLGNGSSLIFSVGMFLLCLFMVQAYYLGFSASMETVTGLPAEVWVAALFALGLYFVIREALNATVATSLLIGLLNIAIILVLSLLASFYIAPANLTRMNVPLVGGQPFDPSILRLIFGVVMLSYFGHLSINTCARMVIRRDPSGRSLMRGGVAAQFTAMFLYVVWVVVVSSVLDAKALASETGTVLAPLAQVVGAAVPVLGTIFVVLSMGMTSIQLSMALYNLVRERLPVISRPTITLPRRQGRLVLEKRGGRLRLTLTYLGLVDNEPHLRLDVHNGDQTRRFEIAPGERWDLNALAGQLTGHAAVNESLALEVVQAGPHSLCLRLDTSLSVSYEGEWDRTGLSAAQFLTLDEAQQKLVTWLVRQRSASLADVAACLGGDEQTAAEILSLMADEGLVVETQVDGQTRYQALFGYTRKRAVPERVETGGGTPAAEPGKPATLQLPWWKRLLAHPYGRLALSISPIVVAFLMAERSLATGADSFSALLGFIGVIAIPILGGIFSTLLIHSSRRKGEMLPGRVFRFLAHPVVLATVFLVNLTGLLIHAWLWEDAFQRFCALAAGLLTVGMAILAYRHGAFNRRMSALLVRDERDGPTHQAHFVAVANGEALEAEVQIEGQQTGSLRLASGAIPNLPTLQRIVLHLPARRVSELLVWVSHLPTEGPALSPARQAYITTPGAAPRPYDLDASDGRLIVPHSQTACQVEVCFETLDN